MLLCEKVVVQCKNNVLSVCFTICSLSSRRRSRQSHVFQFDAFHNLVRAAERRVTHRTALTEQCVTAHNAVVEHGAVCHCHMIEQHRIGNFDAGADFAVCANIAAFDRTLLANDGRRTNNAVCANLRFRVDIGVNMHEVAAFAGRNGRHETAWTLIVGKLSICRQNELRNER